MPVAQASDFGSILWASLALIVLCIVGFFAVATLRRRLRDDDAAAPGGGFTLDDLRRLQAEGKMSQEEFDRAKHQMVAAMKARQARSVLRKQDEEARSRVRGGSDPRPAPRSGPIHHDRPPLD